MSFKSRVASKFEHASTDIITLEPPAELRALTKKRDLLLSKIAKKRCERDSLKEDIHEYARRMQTGMVSLAQKIAEVRSEIHSVFCTIFDKKKFKGKQLRHIHDTYEAMLGVSFAGDGKQSLSEFEASADQEMDEELKKFFKEAGFEDDWKDQIDYEDNSDSNSPKFSTFKKEDRDIRSIFLRLATEFHPDLVQTENEKQQRTAVMQSLNQAFEAKDLAAILAIEKQWSQRTEAGDYGSVVFIQSRIRRMTLEIEILERQLADFTFELKVMKKCDEARELAFNKRQKIPVDAAAEAAQAPLKESLDSFKVLSQFVRDFAEDKISFKQFKKGPEGFFDNFQDEDEDDFDELDEIFEAMFREIQAPSKPRKAKGKRKTSR